MNAASNSEARASLADRIRSEAHISDRPGQLERLEQIATEVERLQRGAHELGRTIEQQCRMVLDVTGLHDWIDEDGDGDWGAIWDRLYELAPKAAQATQTPASQPIPAPVDPGTIGRLNEAQREIVGDMAGCGCCSSRSSIDKVMPDACPNEDGWINHSYSEADGCNQMIPIEDLVERIVREHTDRALAEVEQRIASSVSPNFALRHDGSEDPQAAAYVEGLRDAYEIVRAARQEQGRG